jgi:hypothetical protein
MMLGEPYRIDAEFVGKPGFAQGFVDHDPVALGIAAVGKQKITEFHTKLHPAVGAIAGITNLYAEACQATPRPLDPVRQRR